MLYYTNNNTEKRPWYVYLPWVLTTTSMAQHAEQFNAPHGWIEDALRMVTIQKV